MTDNKYNIGDYVRTENGIAQIVVDANTIVSVDEFNRLIRTHPKDKVKPISRKEAFLTLLKSLLKEFDAYLIAHNTDIPVSVYFNDADDDMPFANLGVEQNKGCGFVIEADNVIDFERK